MAPELDIRLYTADGKRKRLPADWITGASFEIGERGGCLTGSLQVAVPWEQLQLAGTEYVDIRLWGNSQVLYRGWARTAQQELGTPEKANPTLYGLMELLNGYLVPRDFCYGVPQNIDIVFRDIVNGYVAPNIAVQIDTTGIVGTGILLQSFGTAGKTVSQAMNALCDAAPGQLIWGCDVDSLGRNRIYLHPRASSVGTRFSVGGGVTALIYPRDATQVVNRLHITGAKADPALGYPPNLCPNASLEDCVLPGELTSNVLLNPSFDLDNGGTQPGAGWYPIGADPSTDGTYARSSPTAAVFDDNPSTPEGSYQDITVSSGIPVNGSCWAMTIAGETWTFAIKLEYFDVSNTLLDSKTLSWTPPADNVYRKYSVIWDTPSAPTAVRLRYSVYTTSGSGGHGLNVDDTACWFPGLLSAASWEVGGGLSAGFYTADWANPGIPGTIAPYEGGLMLLALPHLFGGGSPYAQIQVTHEGRPDIKSNLAYTLTVHVNVRGSDANVEMGVKLYNGDTLSSTNVGASTTVHAADGWKTITLHFTAGGSDSKAQPFLRFLTNNVAVYVDAFGLYEGSSEPDLYYPGDTLTAVRGVADYALSVSADALASPATWGLREAAETQDTITTKALLDAYCPAYFNAHAVPNVQARLEMDGAAAPLGLDGQVKILNLPFPPPALAPSKVRYDVGATIKISADLNNERPDLALLLRQIALNK